MARTAAIAGTATAVSGGVARRQQAKAEEKAQAAAPQAQQMAPAAAAPAAGDDMVSQLKQLAELRDQGILTDDEFAAQKAKILGS
jgi:membrane protease subunit (stomatin/prohibitin family)